MSIDALIQTLYASTDAAMDSLRSDPEDPDYDAWYSAMRGIIARGSTAAILLGNGQTTLTPAYQLPLVKFVESQITYLDGFMVDVLKADEFMQGWYSRARMYAEAIKEPYWRGKTRMLPLPAMPCEGTQCRTRCGCSWNIVEEDDRYLCTWERGKLDSCQTCLERASIWSPYVITKQELNE